MRKLLLVLPSLCLLGCGGGGSAWWPLEVGKKWTYVVKSGLNSSVETFEVRGRTPVAGLEGFEVVSDGGPSHLVWKNGQLLTNRMAGSSFVPSLPIYVPRAAEWKGLIQTPAGDIKAEAKIATEDAEFKEATRSLPAKKTTLTIRLNKTTRTLTYLYVKDLGLVQHEEFADMALVRSLLLTKGPADSRK